MIKEKNVADSSEKDTKQSILNATVELIREEGFQCATLRKIAAKADTNLALVNYYFGSKENLLGDAMRVLVSTFDNAFQALEDVTLSPTERLKQFFILYVGNLQKYPGFARQLMDQGHHIMCSQDEYARYNKLMRIQKMHDALEEITQVHDRDKLMMMMLQLFGAIFIPLIMIPSSQGEHGSPISIFNPPSIEEQIDGVFEHYFHKYN